MFLCFITAIHFLSIKFNFMETVECPQCGSDAHFDILDEKSAHYVCPNCDYEWCDDSIKAAEEEEDDDDDDVESKN
jgi:transposase-like protein